MAKLSKQQVKNHDKSMALVRNGEELSFSQKEFILENYKPHASNNVVKFGGFYTPNCLAQALIIYLPEPEEYNETVRVLDLCAGIGKLAFIYYHTMCVRHDNIEIVCI